MAGGTTFFSGKDGKVIVGTSDLAHVTGWTFNATSNNPSFASSSTAGFKNRDAGVKDGTGTISGKYDKTEPIDGVMAEGSCVTLKLYQDAARFITVPAVIDGITFNQDIDDGEIHSWDADFSITAAWTYAV